MTKVFVYQQVCTFLHTQMIRAKDMYMMEVNTLPAEAGSFPSASLRPNEGLRVIGLTHCETGATRGWIPRPSIPRAKTLNDDLFRGTCLSQLRQL